MFQSIKSYIKSIISLPTKELKDEISDLKAHILNIESENRVIATELNDLKMHIMSTESNRETMIAEIDRLAWLTVQYASESVWGEVFNNSIYECDWLKSRSFSPGRWALGYQALYVLFRVLSNMKPKHILELGLGQSTRMTTQYAATNSEIDHKVVEHDNEWISFFQNEYMLAENTSIVQLDYDFVAFKDSEAVRVFRGFKDKFQGKKYDLILVDAPLGGDMKQYSRIDILDLLPECLDDRFVIMIDDTERSGEKNTVKEICKMLNQSGIDYAIGDYSGKKSSALICSESLSFLTSL